MHVWYSHKIFIKLKVSMFKMTRKYLNQGATSSLLSKESFPEEKVKRWKTQVKNKQKTN